MLRERIHLDGMPLHIIDTAGLRDTLDPVEAEGVRRAHAEISKADRLLYVVDARDYEATQLQQELQRLPPTIAVTVVINKIDLIDVKQVQLRKDVTHINISAVTGKGLAELSKHLQDCMGYNSSESAGFLARRRHLDALQRAKQHLDQAQEKLLIRKAGELCAEELRLAQLALSEITGEFTSDDLLGRIFSSFCIGK